MQHRVESRRSGRFDRESLFEVAGWKSHLAGQALPVHNFLYDFDGQSALKKKGGATMSGSTKKDPPWGIPLRTLLILPLVSLIVVTTSLIAYLALRNGEKAVNNVGRRLRTEIAARIEEHLDTFLETPQRINRFNETLLGRGLLNANDPDALQHHFWEQIQVCDSVTSIYFGNTAGGLANSGREGIAGSLYMIATDGFKSGPFRKFAVDSQGNHAGELASLPHFDARVRPWYAGAVTKKDDTWSDIYILFTGQDLVLSASRPVYKGDHRLLGVVSVDLFLSHLGDFLRSLPVGDTGRSFIVERSGLLVATSADEKPFVAATGDGKPRRISAAESRVPMVRHAAEALRRQFGDYRNITEARQLEFEMEGLRHFVEVSPVRKNHGLDWITLVVIPESDFMSDIRAGNRWTWGLIVLALALAAGAGIVTVRWITRPLLHLQTSVQALSGGDWNQPVAVGRVRELGELMRSFADMAGQLRETLTNLRSEIAERKRTEEALRKSEDGAKRLAYENAMIAEIGRIISSATSIQDVYKPFAEKVAEILPFDRITISLFDMKEKTHKNLYVEGVPVYGRQPEDTPPLAGTSMESAARTRKGILVRMDDEDKVRSGFPGLVPDFQVGLRSGMTVPLISRDAVIGGFALRSKGVGMYTEQDLFLAEGIGNQIAGAIANSLLYDERRRILEERESLIRELQKALVEVKTLRGILPICASCKKIRDDRGYWNQIEAYVRDHSEAEFSHGLCPDCFEKLYPEYDD
jgi:HAMP domain-containing protein